MPDDSGRMEFASHDALLDRLATAAREVVFLVGAPLTAPAGASDPGVPGVGAMVERIRALFQDRGRALSRLDEALKADPNRYQAAFRHVLHFRGPDAANGIIRSAVLEARLPSARPATLADGAACDGLENDLDGWHYPAGVAALGQLVARHAARFGGTVLTTNFDPLIELSIRRAGGRAFSSVLHGDGSLETARGQGCHVVHVHGYWHGTDTLHSPLQLGQDRPQLRASLARLIRNRTVAVMAYGGWDDIFTRTLQEVTADLGAYPDVLWCFYGSDDARIQTNSGPLFEQLRPAISRQRAIFYKGIDCHAFLPELAAELGNTATGRVLSRTKSAELAPARDDAAFAARKAPQDELLRAFERGQPVQLLGPPSMGKSSLLRWMERTARSLGRPSAFINARGLGGRSPSDLVMAAAEALDKRSVVKDALFAESAVPSPSAAARVLELLSPACLLVDEAGALAEADHGFDRGFFDALRALGQEGKLQWISASEHDLFDLFHSTGLTSAFLNDARKIHVGDLERAEAEALLRERVPQPERVRFAYELGGGFPAALGWLGQHLSRGAVDLEQVERDLRRWIQPLFVLWWQRLDPAGRALLKRCVGEGMAAEGLAETERRAVQRLLDAGFLNEGAGRLVLGGRAWHDFVRDVG
jgi:hypothetical protein